MQLQRDRPIFNEAWAEQFGEHRSVPSAVRVGDFGRARDNAAARWRSSPSRSDDAGDNRRPGPWRPSVTSESVHSGGPIRIEEVGK
jgi:hypothetical protein